MKIIKLTLVFLFVIFCAPLYSQQMALDNVDEFTGEKNLVTQYFYGKFEKKSDRVDEKDQMLLSIKYRKTETGNDLYYLRVKLLFTVDFGCLSEYDGKCIILFDDGSKITFQQQSDTECTKWHYNPIYSMVDKESIKADPSTWLSIMKENFDQIIEKPIDKIRIYGTDGYNDYVLKPEMKDVLQRHAELIKSKL